MAAILKEDPPEPLPVGRPARARAHRGALSGKTREARFQSARDLAFALEVLSGTTAAAMPATVATQRRGAGVTALGVAVVVLEPLRGRSRVG